MINSFLWFECSRSEQTYVFTPDYDGDGVYAADFAFGDPTGESLVAKGTLVGITKGSSKVVTKTIYIKVI